MLHHDDDVNGDGEDEGDDNYEEEDDKYYDKGDNDGDEDNLIFDGCPLIVAAPAVRSKRLLDGKRASFSLFVIIIFIVTVFIFLISYILYLISDKVHSAYLSSISLSSLSFSSFYLWHTLNKVHLAK